MNETTFGSKMRKLGKKHSLNHDKLERMICELGHISLDIRSEQGAEVQKKYLLFQYCLFKEIVNADQSRLRDQMQREDEGSDQASLPK